MINIAQEEWNRANIYKIISQLYYHPVEETEQLLNQFRQCVNQSSPLCNIVEMIVKQFQTNNLLELQVDHTKLFIGGSDTLAPPYSSVYLDRERRVMGVVTEKVIKTYEEAGLYLQDSFFEPPDHISVEFEFMYYLIFQYIKTLDPIYVNRQQDFFINHVFEWVPIFLDRISSRASTNFYKTLAMLTKQFLYMEQQYFDNRM
ncbi:TorD/DmsD family molecular chaperone [Anoxybacillus sp. TBDG-1]